MNGLTLSIEAAIEGGSLSISGPSGEVDRSIGFGRISRAESLLSEVSDLLNRNEIDMNEVSGLVTSLGPGSFTGIRVGIATATGLAKARSIPCVGVTTTEAMLEKSAGGSFIICALPMGRDMVCLQQFDPRQNEIRPPFIVPFSRLEEMAWEGGSEVIVHHGLLRRFQTALGSKVTDAGENLAGLLGRRASGHAVSSSLSPVFAIQQLEND